MPSSVTKPHPVRQTIRINFLRAAFVAILPLLIFGKSRHDGDTLLLEGIEVLGVLFIVFAVIGRLWAVLYIGARKNRTVMRDGPYSMCRHPLYLFSTLGVMGFGMMMLSVIATVVLTGLTFVILMWTARLEERYLIAEFGDDYLDYRSTVPAIIPNPWLFHSPAEVTGNVRTLRVNLFDALVFLAFIPLAELLDLFKETGVIPTFPLY